MKVWMNGVWFSQTKPNSMSFKANSNLQVTMLGEEEITVDLKENVITTVEIPSGHYSVKVFSGPRDMRGMEGDMEMKVK